MQLVEVRSLSLENCNHPSASPFLRHTAAVRLFPLNPFPFLPFTPEPDSISLSPSSPTLVHRLAPAPVSATVLFQDVPEQGEFRLMVGFKPDQLLGETQLSVPRSASPAKNIDPVTNYPNDHFNNGCATSALPSSRSSALNALNAFPIKPVAGCPLVFPHGNSRGSLLHEGLLVCAAGAKYVIRAEVLYEVAKPEVE
ncbi:hypothetical protein JCM8097_007722 [Rhodosporidiobolus ruineniae]